jgi:hypothetical protein
MDNINPNMNPIMPPPPPVNIDNAQQQAANTLAAIQAEQQEMEDALIRLGLTEVSAREFMNNGITSLDRLQVLTQESLTQLIKQIHRDNQGAGLFIPFFSQQCINVVHFWANRMYILGLPYHIAQVNMDLAVTWNEALKAELETRNLPGDIVKHPDPFKKRIANGEPGKKVYILPKFQVRSRWHSIILYNR